jgi:hypothetical protein
MNERRPIPDALLERYLAGDLDEARRKELEARLADSPEERARLDALRADSAAFLIKHPPGPLVAKAEVARPRVPRWLALVLAPVATALLVFVLLRPREPDIGLKGDVALTVYRVNAEGAIARVEPGALLKAGDRVRFEVRAASDGWIAVLSRDGAGRVTVYYPYGGQAAARYSSSEPVLPGAIGLDETKGREDVWVFFSPKPFALTPYVDTLTSGGSPSAAARASWTKD